jgi:hypothetical protein
VNWLCHWTLERLSGSEGSRRSRSQKGSNLNQKSFSSDVALLIGPSAALYHHRGAPPGCSRGERYCVIHYQTARLTRSALALESQHSSVIFATVAPSHGSPAVDRRSRLCGMGSWVGLSSFADIRGATPNCASLNSGIAPHAMLFSATATTVGTAVCSRYTFSLLFPVRCCFVSASQDTCKILREFAFNHSYSCCKHSLASECLDAFSMHSRDCSTDRPFAKRLYSIFVTARQIKQLCWLSGPLDEIACRPPPKVNQTRLTAKHGQQALSAGAIV